MEKEQPLKAESPSLADRDNLSKRESGITAASPMRLRMEAFIKENQKQIVAALEKVDGHKFVVDEWTRPSGGGGISCVLQDGAVFEKAGVNTSVVYGKLPRPAIERMRADHKAAGPRRRELGLLRRRAQHRRPSEKPDGADRAPQLPVLRDGG